MVTVSDALLRASVWRETCRGLGDGDARLNCQVLADEIERLEAELIDTRNAIRLIIGRSDQIPWPDISDSDVDGNIDFVRKQRIATEAKGKNDVSRTS